MSPHPTTCHRERPIVRIDRQAAGSVIFVMSFLFGLGLAALLVLRLVVAILAGVF